MVGRLILSPTHSDIHVPIPRAYEYVLISQKELCKCDKIKDLKTGKTSLCYPGGPNLILRESLKLEDFSQLLAER